MSSRTWPSDWADRMAGASCEMCANGTPERHRHGIRIHQDDHSATYLQWAGPLRGYAVVQWSGRHVAEPNELSEAEQIAYWLTVLKVGAALDAVYGGCKLNYQILGNGLPHLHAHVNVRFPDDPYPGRPLDFTRTEVFPENQIESDARALRAILERP